jgi:hypothetical protein
MPQKSRLIHDPRRGGNARKSMPKPLLGSSNMSLADATETDSRIPAGSISSPTSQGIRAHTEDRGHPRRDLWQGSRHWCEHARRSTIAQCTRLAAELRNARHSRVSDRRRHRVLPGPMLRRMSGDRGVARCHTARRCDAVTWAGRFPKPTTLPAHRDRTTLLRDARG